MNKRFAAIYLCLMLFAAFFSGCGSGAVRLDPKNPVTLSMWHNFGGQMQNTMDQLIDEFNNTVGREQGIIVNVTAISAYKDVEEKLRMIVEGDPGAPEMPDIAPAYPRNAMQLAECDLITELDALFTQAELMTYLPQFIEEGRLMDDKLYVFPFAKSTEVLFVNKTLFDRFAQDTDVTLEMLSSFEGLSEAALKHADWADDDRFFYTADSWFNIAMVGMAQMGGGFVEPERLGIDAGGFRRVWDFAARPALSRGFAVVDGYSSDLSKTGEIICSTGSTAGILFYGDSVTYSDNTTELVEYVILPYPTFEGGKKIALQRGAGLVVAKSTPQKEYASAVFLKWFTQPAQNMKLVSSTGYLPVTKEAFEKNMTEEIALVENANVKKLLEISIQMYNEYDFMVAPNYDAFDAMSKEYEANLKHTLREGREQVLEGADAQAVSDSLFERFAH